MCYHCPLFDCCFTFKRLSMKKIIFVITLLYSLVSQAQIVCPMPEELKINIMDFTDWSTVDTNPLQQVDKHLFIGTNLIEVNNSIWYLVLGLVDEKLPQITSKAVITKSKSQRYSTMMSTMKIPASISAN